MVRGKDVRHMKIQEVEAALKDKRGK